MTIRQELMRENTLRMLYDSCWHYSQPWYVSLFRALCRRFGW